MKYLLMITVDPAVAETLPLERRRAAEAAQHAFRGPLHDSGELVGFAALADPANSATVVVRDGVAAVTEGPCEPAGGVLAGLYLLDCESADRARELAAMVPGLALTAVEVRPLMTESGMEM